MSGIAALDDVESKIGVMVAISLVSLFAVSFPTLSKHLPFLHIPPIVFFVGKHFGTGVILATAFLHLLDDAFRSLRSPVLESKYGKIGKWTGLIILASLLSIFLIEYASTTYVEHLRSKPPTPSTSAPPTPKPSFREAVITRSPSRHIPNKHISISDISETTPLLLAQQVVVEPLPLKPSSTTSFPASLKTSSAVLKPKKSFSIPTPAASAPGSRSRPHSQETHHPHPLPSHVPYSKPPTILPMVDFIEVLTNSPRICRLGLAGEHQHHHHQHDHEHHGEDDRVVNGRLSRRHSFLRLETQEDGDQNHDQHHSDSVVSPTIGRKRQIVSILVLQLGIMIHSLVIGLTLAVATGSDFTSLTTAIIFHQLFEGLSLGIRIAAIPPPKKTHDDPTHDENGCSGNVWVSKWKRWKDIHWLKPTLSFLFAVTTPSGMTLGILAFGPGQRKDAASMLLIQGVMSAISAGMLIYAATVEMIAGDFVFGDVDGGYHHHHHHDQGHQQDDDRPVHGADETGVLKRGRNGRIADAEANGRDVVGENGVHDPGSSSPMDEDGEDPSASSSSLAKRMLAVVSLLMGVVMMIVVGIGE